MRNSSYISFFNHKDDLGALGVNLSSKLKVAGKMPLKQLQNKLAFELCFIKKTYKMIVNRDVSKGSLLKWEEWLGDNYYILEREIKNSLNNILEIGELPFVKINKNKLPAIYCFALVFCESTHNKFGDKMIADFLLAAQKSRAFEIKELETFVLMLRLALCEQIYFVCSSKIENIGDEEKGKEIGNAIMSLKFLSNYDFADCFKQVSRVDNILEKDPAKVYSLMTDETKQIYRKRITELSHKKNISELALTNELLKNAQDTKGTEQRHIGHELFKDKRKRKDLTYIFLQIFLPIIISLLIGFAFKSFFVAVIIYLPLWEFIKLFIDFIISKNCKPDYLPQIELKEKIPEVGATAVVISCLITSKKDIEHMEERLEKIYFANRGGAIVFGVLADFPDSKSERLEFEEELKSKLKDIIDVLNLKYDNSFYAILRKRSFNAVQKKYMGWERKRGAIVELVKFVKGLNVNFDLAEGAIDKLKASKYMITLDSDTSLPLNAARELVGTMLHPLNTPKLDKKNKIIVKGYGLITPRIGTDLKSANQTIFSKITAGFGGTETYNNPAFDVYQELFSEGIFSGKGIIDINAFYHVAADRFPENRILSHDLLEGCFLRTGYMSNLVLVDSFPAGVLSYFDRQHRWIRGDWQASPYLLEKIPVGNSEKGKNPLNTVSRWKIFDNLRRALTPLAIILALLLSSINSSYIVALYISLLAVLGSQLISILDMLFHNGLRIIGMKYSTKTYSAVTASILRGIISFILLPFNAYISLDASIRALWRLLVSKKKLLDWVTAAQSDAKHKGTITEYMYRMVVMFLIGACFLLSSLILGKIIGIIFIVTPFVAYQISKKEIAKTKKIPQNKRDRLTDYARDMWRYFSKFLNEDNNYLPPDNYQETPLGIEANRTSPTNIGLATLCCLTARDFGFINTDKMVQMLYGTLNTMKHLSKWNGHLFNWYDTVKLTPLTPRYVSTVDSGNLACSLITLIEGLREYENESKDIPELIREFNILITEMDFKPLYNEKKKLLYIGFDVDNQNIDKENFYDLYMSEARMTSYYLAAKNEIPKKHWFTLGRLMTTHRGYFGLKSWTGTMFEYFMPHIFLPLYYGSLSFEALHYAFKSQRDRVKGKKIPWGISESGFYAFDVGLNYQYKAFGVQRLGLKRGLDKELIISPYSTFLTLPFFFDEAYENLEFLRKNGMYGKYGFYEAADYTGGKENGQFWAVKSYMAHHIGMSLLSVNNALNENTIQNRFMRCKQMLCAEELLQEKLPSNVVVYNDIVQNEIPDTTNRRHLVTKLESNSISLTAPRGMVLSNGTICETILDSGAGYLSFYDKNLTRYRPDIFKNPRGIFILVKDEEKIHSLTYAPLYENREGYKVEFNENSAVFKAKLCDIETKMSVCISGKGQCEAREIKIKNNSAKAKNLEILFYLEPVLTKHENEKAHPLFSGLFIEAGFDKGANCLIFHRREKDSKQNGYNLCVGIAGEYKNLKVETMRENVLSRLTGTEGLKQAFFKSFKSTDGCLSTIDPCAAIRANILVPQRAVRTVNLYISSSNIKEDAIRILNEAKRNGFADLLKSAELTNNSLTKDVEVTEGENRLISELIPNLYYLQSGEKFNILATDKSPGIKFLWRYGISGDLPIVLLEVKDKEDVHKAKIFINCFKLLKIKNRNIDLIFIFNEGGQYDRPIYNTVKELIKANNSNCFLEMKGGIHLVNTNSEVEMGLFKAAAEFYANLNFGFEMNSKKMNLIPSFIKMNRPKPSEKGQEANYATAAGGFTENGFIINDKRNWENRPPWSLVLANKSFGTLLSDSSLGFTFARNSRENKITKWENDVVTDNTGEKLYIRIDGEIFDLCAGGETTFFDDYAIYEANIGKINVKAKVFTGLKHSYKAVLTEITNEYESPRRVDVCYYTEPVLGFSNYKSNKFLNIYEDEKVIIIKNAENSDFNNGFAYLTANGDFDYTNSKIEFLQGVWDLGIKSGNIGGSCAVCSKSVLINEGKTEKVVFVLGYSASKKDMNETLSHLSTPDLAEKQLALILKKNQNKIEIETPNKELNLLFNHFLYNQVVKSRLYSRTGFYQNGGAFGFRDQLQDAIGVCSVEPKLLEIQIYRSAAHQFEEGDVLHWWHEILDNGKKSRGVRTKCSDDLLWLPFAVCECLDKTGNEQILDKKIKYIKGPELKKEEYDKYIYPEISELKEDVYMHCIRAINKGATKGSHGLALFGNGDWNDGMNRVGHKGYGESVWLTMFIILVLERFIKVCDLRNDSQNKENYLRLIEEYRKAVEENAWDGEWYLRGFYDDGQKLGSKENADCKIDILPQSYSAITGGFDKERMNKALNSAKELLVDEKNGLVKLLTPAFQSDEQNPGYIKGYIPGTRENGGQYTHSAVWYALSLAKIGNIDEAINILSMINPVNHSNTIEKAKVYRIEPYVLAGDVYSSADFAGRGGWSWYTGSAGWYYKTVLEYLLGIKRIDNKISLKPNMPSLWNEFSVKINIDNTIMNIKVLKGNNAEEKLIELDGKTHNIEIFI